MKFINRHVMIYAGIVLATTLLLYFALIKQNTIGGTAVGIVTILYIFALVFSSVMISRRDEYQGFFGFNYHLTAYIICVAVPLALYVAHLLPDVSFVPTMALFWGVGVAIHFIVYLIVFRKRRIRNYDKREIFK